MGVLRRMVAHRLGQIGGLHVVGFDADRAALVFDLYARPQFGAGLGP